MQPNHDHIAYFAHRHIFPKKETNKTKPTQTKSDQKRRKMSEEIICLIHIAAAAAAALVVVVAE